MLCSAFIEVTTFQIQAFYVFFCVKISFPLIYVNEMHVFILFMAWALHRTHNIRAKWNNCSGALLKQRTIRTQRVCCYSIKNEPKVRIFAFWKLPLMRMMMKNENQYLTMTRKMTPKKLFIQNDENIRMHETITWLA